MIKPLIELFRNKLLTKLFLIAFRLVPSESRGSVAVWIKIPVSSPPVVSPTQKDATEYLSINPRPGALDILNLYRSECSDLAAWHLQYLPSPISSGHVRPSSQHVQQSGCLTKSQARLGAAAVARLRR